jgi:hypothetical protein
MQIAAVTYRTEAITPMIAGTATFTLASIGCALAPSLTWLAVIAERLRPRA